MNTHHKKKTLAVVAAAVAIAILCVKLTGPAKDAGTGNGTSEKGEVPPSDDHGAHADEVTLAPEVVERNGIRTAVAKSLSLVGSVTAPARVSFNAEQVAHIGAAVTGRVAELNARVGDSVKAGDPLLVIDSPELGEAQSDFLQKRTAEQVAVPSVSLAKSGYQRTKGLFDKSQGTTLTDVQKREGEWRAAEGQALAAQASATAARNKLTLLGMTPDQVADLERSGALRPQSTVRAPIAGQVVERNVTLGELVGPDKEKLLVVADLSSVWVLADVPEAKLQQLSVGAKATLTVGGDRGPPIEGQVSYLAPSVDPATRSVRFRVVVPNADRRLLPGMFATAEIQTTGGPGDAPVVAVPEDAVQSVEGKSAVFVPAPGEPGTFEKRAVTVGPPVGGMVPVLSGLKDGDPYVSSGGFILKAELGKEGAAHEH